jgi:DNA-binding IclR family transcriptional regulator
VWGVSAPLFGRPSQFHGVVTVMAPSARGRARRDEILAMTIETARRISLHLADDAAS